MLEPPEITETLANAGIESGIRQKGYDKDLRHNQQRDNTDCIGSEILRTTASTHATLVAEPVFDDL
jgi:hypothetical protein